MSLTSGRVVIFMMEIRQILLGGHILLAILWVGGILFVGWGVFPVIRKFSFTQQRQFLTRLMKHTHIIFTLIGAGVVVTGFLLGTIFGPIKGFSQVLETSYGIKFLLANGLGIFALVWGAVIGYRKTMKMLADDSLWSAAEAGKTKPLNKTFLQVTMIESVEIISFVCLIYLMISF